jgi:hypothetical protein
MAYIGELRRFLFVPFDCKWNSLVREVTAEHELGEGETEVYATYKQLVQVIRDNGQLDHAFPTKDRLGELFDTDHAAALAKAEAENAQLREQIERLKAPVSDEEWSSVLDNLGPHGLARRKGIDDLIAARAAKEGRGKR